MSKIPKILIQTNIKKIEDHVISKLSNVFPGWSYYNFESDHKRIQFFLENPIDDFPNIVQKYNILQGAHKSDLLRYYFLYLYGGVYLDDDAMIYDNIDNIIYLNIPLTKLNELASIDFISFVEPIDSPGEPENSTSRTLIRSNVLNSTFLKRESLSVLELTISVKDSICF